MTKTKKPKRPFPTQIRLHELLERKYDSEGKLYFVAKVKRWSVKVGDVLYGYEFTANKGYPSEHIRYNLTIDDHTQTITVWNYVFEYGNYNRDIFSVDHIDRDPLNDHHSNLKLSTRSGQQKNRNNYKKKGSSSNYHGVCLDKKTGKWHVRYRDKDNSNIQHIGYYTDEKAAAQAYDLTSWKICKNPKNLNFPNLIPIYNSFELYQTKHPDATISMQ